MSEINREAFGAFLAAQRKEKGYTQKDPAAKLFISDKAVSKWERGLSLPDVQLLIPLAEALGVSVAELLDGRKSEPVSTFNAEQVEVLIKKNVIRCRKSAEHPCRTTINRFVPAGGIVWDYDSVHSYRSGRLFPRSPV